MKLHADICLIALLGVALLCKTGEDGKTPVSDFCELTAVEVRKLEALTPVERASLSRQRKEAIVSLRRKHRDLCPSS